jgi:hypothetical protein
MTPRTAGRRPVHSMRSVGGVLNAMRGGAALHHYFAFSEPVYVLTDGRRVDPTTAEAVIRNPQIAPVGEALFQGLRPQTFRFVETEIQTAKECR